jgi:hypothetical protein
MRGLQKQSEIGAGAKVRIRDDDQNLCASRDEQNVDAQR